MADLDVAIIGYGLAGSVFHAPLVDAAAGLRVAGIVTGNPERREQAAAEYPEATLYESPDELWEAAESFDAVVIATPNHLHAPLATSAIDRRLAVVVDKPLALSSAEAEQLIAHASAAGVPLTVFHNRRWDSDQLTLARLIADGSLGTVLRYESRFERWRPQSRPEAWREERSFEQGGGLLLDLGSHLVDEALHNFGPAALVYAEIDNRRGTPADDDVFLAITHRSGVISHLHASALTAAAGPRLRVLGSEAALIVDGLDTQEDRLRAGERPGSVPDWGTEPADPPIRLVAGDAVETVRGERGNWPAFYALFADALAGRGALPVDPSDAVQTLRLLEAARVSASERTVVELL